MMELTLIIITYKSFSLENIRFKAQQLTFTTYEVSV